MQKAIERDHEMKLEVMLDALTVAQLRMLAKRAKVTLKTGMHKRNIINRLLGAVPRKTLVVEAKTMLRRQKETAPQRYCSCVQKVKASQRAQGRPEALAFPICRVSTKAVGKIVCPPK